MTHYDVTWSDDCDCWMWTRRGHEDGNHAIDWGMIDDSVGFDADAAEVENAAEASIDEHAKLANVDIDWPRVTIEAWYSNQSYRIAIGQ